MIDCCEGLRHSLHSILAHQPLLCARHHLCNSSSSSGSSSSCKSMGACMLQHTMRWHSLHQHVYVSHTEAPRAAAACATAHAHRTTSVLHLPAMRNASAEHQQLDVTVATPRISHLLPARPAAGYQRTSGPWTQIGPAAPAAQAESAPLAAPAQPLQVKSQGHQLSRFNCVVGCRVVS